MSAAEAVQLEPGVPPIFKVREGGKPMDLDFVVGAWVRANADSHLGHALGPCYFSEHRARVVAELAKPHAKVRVAHVPDDENAILGFCVTASDETIVHYVYVRKEVRRKGIARALLRPVSERAICTHRPRQDVAKELRLPKGWVFNPYKFLGVST